MFSFVCWTRCSLWIGNNIQDRHNDPRRSGIHCRVKLMSILFEAEINLVLKEEINENDAILPVDMSQ